MTTESPSTAEEQRSPETLAEALAEGLAPARLLEILAEVADSLQELHAAGRVHLGVHPDAILVGSPATLREPEQSFCIGEVPTAEYIPGYSAPELRTGEPVDPRADVYGVGAVLYHALNQRTDPATDGKASPPHHLTTWTPLPAVAGVPQILHRCLGPRERRYPGMSALRRDLLSLSRQQTPPVRYTLAAASTIGLSPSRPTNQDAHGYLTGHLAAGDGARPWSVLCLADGLGGEMAGEVASQTAVQTCLAAAAGALTGAEAETSALQNQSEGGVPAEAQTERTRQWVQQANEQVCDVLAAARAQGGTTLVCACLLDRRLTAAHVGDSRLYLLRDGQARCLTRDHSLAMAQVLQGMGPFEGRQTNSLPCEAVRGHPDRHQVTRSLGERRELPDYYVDSLTVATGSESLDLEPGDVLLLCCDGVWEPVREEEMVRLVATAPDLSAAADRLLALVLERGAPDNATVLLARLEEG